MQCWGMVANLRRNGTTVVADLSGDYLAVEALNIIGSKIDV